jgi:hypothetical protein
MKTVFSIYFEDPFWVGVFEAQATEIDGRSRRLGSEPSDAEVRDLLLNRYDTIPFSATNLPEGEAPLRPMSIRSGVNVWPSGSAVHLIDEGSRGSESRLRGFQGRPSGRSATQDGG